MTSGRSPVSAVPLWHQILLSTHSMFTYFIPTESLFGSSAPPPFLSLPFDTPGNKANFLLCVHRRVRGRYKFSFVCIFPSVLLLHHTARAVFEDQVLKNRLSVPEPWLWVIQKYAYLHPTSCPSSSKSRQNASSWHQIPLVFPNAFQPCTNSMNESLCASL